MFRKYCYVIPYTKDFEEKESFHVNALLYTDAVFERKCPPVCWERPFGWLDGYGVLFDPVLQTGMEAVPEFSNGAPEKTEQDVFYVTAGGEATGEFHPEGVAGLFLCPEKGRAERISQKERLLTPCGEYFLPPDFPYTDAEGNDPEWRLGERSALLRKGQYMELYFELFFMIGYLGHEFPHRRLLTASDLLSHILPSAPEEIRKKFSDEFRLDCQSYGICRMFLQWILRLLKKDPEEVRTADEAYLAAIRLCETGDQKSAEESLKKSFTELFRIRTKYIPMDLQIAEFPHAGILFPESGFFELEWPEGSRRTINGHLDDVELLGYRTSFELSAGDWLQLKKMYPEMISRIGDLWQKKEIELTNGTLSLPYAFISPLTLQYYQFRYGRETFRSVFGKMPELYQCQENSFTPQMPEMLNHFGYKGVLYCSLNHGSPACESLPQICWESPSGSGLPALTAEVPEQFKLGFNFFLALPIILLKYRDRKAFKMFNFMDLGFVSFRESIIRAAKYAPVFGRFITGSALLEEFKEPLPGKSYTSDDYHFSAESFYNNYTNKNALSHFEHLFALSSEFRALQMLSGGVFSGEEDIVRQLCLLEAHDCDRVQGQRPGEFYYRKVNEPSPASRKELSELLAKIRTFLRKRFDEVYHDTVPEKTDLLFNSGEVPLTFAELRHEDKYSGSFFEFCGRKYVAGCFPPLSAGVAEKTRSSGMFRSSSDSGTLGDWSISVKDQNIMIRKGEKCVSFLPVDHQHGTFRCESSRIESDENWLTIRLIFTRTSPEPEILVMEGITTLDSDYLEWTLRYSGRNHFSESKRWEDFLGLSFAITPGTILRNYVPSMMAETREEKIMSSYCLGVEDGFSLLFSGVGNFYRRDNQLFWLFHVANETEWERKIVISFSGKSPALCSRGVLTGLYPVSGQTTSFPDLLNGNITVECAIGEKQWLVSNATAEIQTPELPSGAVLDALDGSEANLRSLKPWQLAVLRLS